MSEVLDVETIDHVVKLAKELPILIRPWRSPSGVEYYLFDRLTGKPIDGPTFMIDQAIASSQGCRRQA